MLLLFFPPPLSFTDWKTVMMETFTSRGMLNELDGVTKYLLDMTQGM